MTETSNVGYKAFNKKFQCRDGFQYEVGKTYKLPSETKLELCQAGFHYCHIPIDCDQFYPPECLLGDVMSPDEQTRYAIVQATGNIVSDVTKSATDEITILREIGRKELLELCTGDLRNKTMVP